MILINIKDLNKTYHNKHKETEALKNITFNIKDGEVLSIIGSSGCGKSTLLDLITGEEKTSSGIIQNNRNLRIGYMMQEDALLPWLTVLDNVLIGLKLRHNLSQETKTYAISLIKKYGLEEFINEYPDNLSGGMRQRVG